MSPAALCRSGWFLDLGGAPVVISSASGRLPAAPAGVQGLLLAQVRETLALAVAAHGATPFAAADLAAIRAQLRFIPAAGELPLGFLLQPAAVTAACPFWPPGMDVDLATIRVSEARGVIARGLSRAPIDLQAPTEDGVLLLLAVPDQEWQPDLLDMPRADPLLPADLFQAYVATLTRFIATHRSWSTLYGGLGSHAGDANRQTLNFLRLAVSDPNTLSVLMQLPDPAFLALLDTAGNIDGITTWLHQQTGVVIPAPPDANTLTAQLAADGYRILDAGQWHRSCRTRDAATGSCPTPRFGLSELAGATTTTNPTDDSNPANQGALLRLILLHTMQTILALAARRLEILLHGHDRLIALQRAHLDTLSSYGSALAGGVPADGKGMQIARMLPFIKLTPAAPTGGTPTVAPTFSQPITHTITRSFSTAAATLSELPATEDQPYDRHGDGCIGSGQRADRHHRQRRRHAAWPRPGRSGQCRRPDRRDQHRPAVPVPGYRTTAPRLTSHRPTVRCRCSRPRLDNLIGLAAQINLTVPAATTFPPPPTGVDAEHVAYANMLLVGRDLLAQIDAAERNSQIIEASATGVS